MASGTVETTIARSPEDVFRYVSDLERAPEWVPDLLSVTEVSEGDIQVGTRYTEVVQMGSSPADAELIVTDVRRAPRVRAQRQRWAVRVHGSLRRRGRR